MCSQSADTPRPPPGVEGQKHSIRPTGPDSALRAGGLRPGGRRSECRPVTGRRPGAGVPRSRPEWSGVPDKTDGPKARPLVNWIPLSRLGLAVHHSETRFDPCAFGRSFGTVAVAPSPARNRQVEIPGTITFIGYAIRSSPDERTRNATDWGRS